MADNLIFNVDVDVLLRAGISINQYFMLHLIKNKRAELYMNYRELFSNPVTKDDMLSLIKNGYLATRSDPNKFTFDNLLVTPKFIGLNEIKIEDALEELANTYPKVTPGKKRRLQSDQHKWGPKYLSIIKKDRTLHNRIITCIKAEAIHRKATGNEEFWPLLTTYVNNKRWLDYMEDIVNFTEENKFSRDI